MKNEVAIVIGAGSEIAKALVLKLHKQMLVVALSRDLSYYCQAQLEHVHKVEISTYSESNIAHAAELINIKIQGYSRINIFVCNGLLHNERCFPEKRIEDFSADSFSEIMSANALTAMLWLKYLTPLMASKISCKVVVFSARVGSIGDNQLGGWYSYRASKAALNMLLKCVSIEFSRRAKNIKLISFHPGTTDSPLSKPFQKNVAKDKLFTSDFVAGRLIDIIEQAELDGELSYLDWQGNSIVW
ncbi:SDR family NAD(P)-dependent oxidoreductase [Agaribacterium sp. ZY112]|uniref:SDR family NAD(P)-dependent oxidoreductase n=1 Tax=Agaribacterium sp. ZY112 TaxID=3233574 RepID=UPI00352628EF